MDDEALGYDISRRIERMKDGTPSQRLGAAARAALIGPEPTPEDILKWLKSGKYWDVSVEAILAALRHFAREPEDDPPKIDVETCKGCHYWKQTSSGDEYNKPRGNCRIKPPCVTAPNEGFREWPITEDADWCGEWRAVAKGKGDE